MALALGPFSLSLKLFEGGYKSIKQTIYTYINCLCYTEKIYIQYIVKITLKAARFIHACCVSSTNLFHQQNLQLLTNHKSQIFYVFVSPTAYDLGLIQARQRGKNWPCRNLLTVT